MTLPDLSWKPPLVLSRWYRAVPKYPTIYPCQIVLHDTEGAEDSNAAENGASYNQRRADQTSCNRICDPDSTIQCVPDGMIAFAQGFMNDFGTSLEICGVASQTIQDWFTPPGLLDQVAWNVASWSKQFGIPVVFLYAEDLAINMQARGITTHYELSRACSIPGQVRDYMLKNGSTPNTHTDPGAHFYPPRGGTFAGWPIGYVFDKANQLLTVPAPNTGDELVQVLIHAPGPYPNGNPEYFAVFQGDMDAQGTITSIRRLGPRVNGIIGFMPDNVTPRIAGTKVLERSKASMKDFTLIGPVPTGDKVPWVAGDFYMGD